MSCVKSQQFPLDHVIVRLDGQYGDGAIVADLKQYGLAYIMRGKDYDLLNLPEIQARLAQPPDQVVTHPETGMCRALFDCLDVPVTAMGPRTRVIIATHPATATAARIGSTRDGVVYELFFTCLPPAAFTAADVLDLYAPLAVAPRPSSLMKTRSRTSTAGFRIPPVGRNFGKFSPNGCGMYVSNWVTVSIRLPCVRLSSPRPKHNRLFNQQRALLL